jgi:hypothetical protein
MIIQNFYDLSARITPKITKEDKKSRAYMQFLIYAARQRQRKANNAGKA